MSAMSLGNKAVKGVRFAGGAGAHPGGDPQGAPAVRRRPRQGRALASAQALLDAFVRVLLERGYARTTIREVVAVAGVGIGTFYEYFGNKHALAALWIHQRVQALEQSTLNAAHTARGQALEDVAGVVVNAQLNAVLAATPEWAALFLLERQISSIDAFRAHYERWVALWQHALLAAGDPPADPAGAARLLHALSYGWVSQSLLSQGAGLDAQRLRADLQLAVTGVVERLPRENTRRKMGLTHSP